MLGSMILKPIINQGRFQAPQAVPPLSFAAPAESSACDTSVYPRRAAQCRGVSPQCALGAGSALASSNTLTQSKPGSVADFCLQFGLQMYRIVKNGAC